MRRLVLAIAFLPAAGFAQSWQGATYFDRHNGSCFVAVKPITTVPGKRFDVQFGPFAGVTLRSNQPVGGFLLSASHEVFQGVGWLLGAGLTNQPNRKVRLGLAVGVSVRF